ncbi:MAG: biotin--[acetyl-CoA-carboxylase] ligase [Candidatus Omnitrophica bacterium]|jgi:BirA family biotin operon repressor/biotin-[acetyl-CoA-carboxylase] ligase|nr:biotin--[acetyl-CoA-carboxylase] ligase [Candidatus Omnitrophota bacterium]MDD5252560.1 biotin--[acetyl-CoA-carboxylase] ligase [Candidatus Omnitrophota bacterium]
MKEKILGYLKKEHEYLSGDEIASRLGISRQGLWKHIQDLKDSGYDIVAVPHLGYRLLSSPDRLFALEITHGLNTKFIAKKIHYFDYLASTMDLAMQLGMQSAVNGTLVLAESQTKGRGRLGRNWFSPKYKGIYLSLILRPKIPPSVSPVLTLLSAVSICEAVKKVGGLDAQIKWPNDIFINNKKIAGILTELNAEVDKVNFVVIGIGLNVNNDKSALIAQATSLKEQLGQPISRVGLLQELLRRIENNYSLFEDRGAKAIIDKCRSFSLTLGRRVKIYCQDKHIEGAAVDIDQDGALLIRKDSGLVQKVFSGDVMHCRQP